jgi:hypothetical protein
MGDARPSMDVFMDEFGVSITVTRPDADPIETTGIWVTPLMIDAPSGQDFQRRDRKRVLAVRRDEVPAVPRGTRIVAPELAGDTALLWTADGIEFEDADHLRVIVIRHHDDS